MLKKIAALCCALMMALTLLPAQAADVPLSAVYRLVSRDAQGTDTLLGCAVLVRDQVTLVTTVHAASAKGGLYALGDDGDHALVRGFKPNKDSELVVLTMAEPSAATPLTLHADGIGTGVLGCGTEGQVTLYPATVTGKCDYAGEACDVLTAAEGLLPGGALTDDTMALTGLLAASVGEGVGRYAALPAAAIAKALTSSDAASDEETALPEDAAPQSDATETVWLEGVTLSEDKGLLLVDWSGSTVVDLAEDSVFEVFYADTANGYYSYRQAQPGDTSCRLPAVPGRTYLVWVQHGHGEAATDVLLPQTYASITLPEARPFNKYGYVETSIYLGTLPAADEDVNQPAEALDELTPAAIVNPDTTLYLQVTSRYRTKLTTQSNLVTVLLTPEGYAFATVGSFLFDPALAEGDTWHVAIGKLFDDYGALNGGFSDGTYRVAYYFDGALVNAMEYFMGTSI